MSHEENSRVAKITPEPVSERSKITSKLRGLLSNETDTSLYKLCVYLDYQAMEGTYTSRVEKLANKYYRTPQTIKNYLVEMGKEKPETIKSKLKKLKEILL